MASVLVIDANPRNRKQVEGILRLRTNHTVSMAEDGIQAFERLEKDGLPDLIMMDLFLPRINGFHVYKVLKEKEATAGIPIILSTSVDLDPVTEARVGQLKLDGRVQMPVSASEIVELISLVLIRKKEVKEIQKEPIDGGPEGVSRVIWPRVERPEPTPLEKYRSEFPEAEKKEVRQVVWPKAGSRGDPGVRGQDAPLTGEKDRNPFQPSTPLSGRDLRAQLAKQATQKPGLDPGDKPFGSTDNEIKKRRVKRGGRGPSPDKDQEKNAIQSERAKALLKLAKSGKPNVRDAKQFQPFPMVQADPDKVVNFTKKGKKDQEKGEGPEKGDKGARR